MKKSVMIAIAIVLIGSSAHAQLFPGYGPSVPYSSGTSASPQGIAAYGTPAGVNIYDPYGTLAAASRFGTSSSNPRDPYGTLSAASKFGPPPGYAVMPR
jgi:hypothetical protein